MSSGTGVLSRVMRISRGETIFQLVNVNVTAQGEGHADCVSLSFAPKLNVSEDPVCGFGHRKKQR